MARRLDRIERSRGWQFWRRLRCQSGRSYEWKIAAQRFVRALRASRRCPFRKRILLRLAELRHMDAFLDAETNSFALEMPVEFFAEFRARKKALLAKETALARISPRAAPEFAEALVLELTAFHEWFIKRAEDYRRPWMDELVALCRAGERRKQACSAA